MATSTPNYGLHQWECGDQIRRTELNQDLGKLDTALKAAEEQAATDSAAASQRAEEAKNALEPFGYNCLNLMLQNCYAGAPYKYMKNLALDGFVDNSRIESTTNGMTWDATEKHVILQAVGQSSLEDNFDTRRLVEISVDTPLRQNFVAPSTGRITAVEIYFSGRCTVSIRQNDTVLGSATATASQSNYSTKVSLTAEIQRGGSYAVCLQAGTSGSYVYSGSNVDNFGFRLSITPVIATSGTLVTTLHSLGDVYQRASAWVRHSVGSVSLSFYNQQSGSWLSMAAVGKRATVTPKGIACTESSFRLTEVPTGNQNVKLRLGLFTSNGTNAILYDYGVVVS